MTDTALGATRWFSLRRRLLLLLLGGVTAGWLTALGFSYVDAHHEIDELFDAQMAQVAQTLLALAGEYEDDDDIVRLPSGSHHYQKKFIFQLWDAQGNLLLRSQDAPLQPLSMTDGFSESPGDGGWRFYSQWDRERQLRVQVAEHHHVREKLARHIARRLLLPVLFGLPLLGAWVWFATRRGLAPLDEVAAELQRRASERLDPVVPKSAPSEVRPLLEALNALFGRVAWTLDNERRFTADAAHELRTPLAAITTQAQVAQRARDAAEREHALVQIEAGSRRAARLVEQLLTLSRLDPADRLPAEPLRLDLLAAEVCADHGVTAVEKDITLELDAPQAVTVAGDIDMLRVLLRNLIDNALRFTPAGGKVGVGVTADVLTVADSGPGIPVAERDTVLRRFHRLAGQEIPGSGLGLSIVARIAELHGASLVMADNAPGLLVRLEFPCPPLFSNGESACGT